MMPVDMNRLKASPAVESAINHLEHCGLGRLPRDQERKRPPNPIIERRSGRPEAPAWAQSARTSPYATCSVAIGTCRTGFCGSVRNAVRHLARQGAGPDAKSGIFWQTLIRQFHFLKPLSTIVRQLLRGLFAIMDPLMVMLIVSLESRAQ